VRAAPLRKGACAVLYLMAQGADSRLTPEL